MIRLTIKGSRSDAEKALIRHNIPVIKTEITESHSDFGSTLSHCGVDSDFTGQVVDWFCEGAEFTHFGKPVLAPIGALMLYSFTELDLLMGSSERTGEYP